MNPPELTQRLNDLEVKFSFIEEHITQQDREILKLRTFLEKQSVELERLRDAQNGDGLMVRGDEKPPHY